MTRPSAPPAYRQLRLCSSGGGFEAIPQAPFRVDLSAVRHRLEAAGVAVTDARVMLIAALGPEVTISVSGRMLFKTGDRAAADAAFQRLLPLLFA